jgi:hypothetical protein
MIEMDTTLGQHMMIERLLDMPQPVTIAQVLEATTIGDHTPAESNVRNWLETLHRKGWLTKGTAPKTGRRGKPSVEYALVAGARRVWEEREARLQEGYAERQAWDDALLG